MEGCAIQRRAFTLIELLVVVAVIALLIGILLPALASARRTSRAAVCGSNMKQLGVGTQSYAVDHDDQIFSFSWRGSPTEPSNYSTFADLNGAVTDLDAAALQAFDILRRATSRGAARFPRPVGWIPHVLYSHLVLQDYLAKRLPEPTVLCPEDRVRREWQRMREPSELLAFTPGLFPGREYRETFGSSYQMPSAAYDPAQSQRGQENIRVSQHPTRHDAFDVDPGTRLGGVRFTRTAFPAQKVMMHDSHGRHTDDQPTYFGLAETRQPLLMYDISVGTRRTGDANVGWKPDFPRAATIFRYLPNPVAFDGQPDPQNPGGDICRGYYRWTRGGLLGVDYGGDEIAMGK